MHQPHRVCNYVTTYVPTKYTRFEFGAHAYTEAKRPPFCVVNALRSGKNPGLVYGGRQEKRDSCGAAGSACHEPMGSPSNADDDDILYFVTRNLRQVSNNAAKRRLYPIVRESKRRLVELSSPRLPVRSLESIYAQYIRFDANILRTFEEIIDLVRCNIEKILPVKIRLKIRLSSW